MFALLPLLSRAFTRRSSPAAYLTQGLAGGGDAYFEPLSPKLQKALTLCIPELSYDKHKGQAGRMVVIGGSDDFTGAPYYAGISALKCGADLVTVMTSPSAAGPIKCYSPELMVTPCLHGNEAAEHIISFLPRAHSVVIGPGLGRDTTQLNSVETVIDKIKEQELPMVIDADGLFLVTNKPDIVQGYKKLILTPNAAEFDRLYLGVMGRSASKEERIINVKQLAEKMQVTILRKGLMDIVSDGTVALVVSTETSPRRSGGQGDLLSGILSVFNFWMHQAESQPQMSEQSHMQLYGPTLLAAVAACSMMRECSRRAFSQKGRATLATDIIPQIGPVFSDLFDNSTQVDKLYS